MVKSTFAKNVDSCFSDLQVRERTIDIGRSSRNRTRTSSRDE